MYIVFSSFLNIISVNIVLTTYTFYIQNVKTLLRLVGLLGGNIGRCFDRTIDENFRSERIVRFFLVSVRSREIFREKGNSAKRKLSSMFIRTVLVPVG